MKAAVLLSGGIDSTTCLAMAVKEFGADNVIALNMHYGQKHEKECLCAQKIASYYKVKYYEHDISSAFKYSNCSLLATSDKKIKHESYAQQLEELGGEGTVETYVPFRNGVMLSIASAIALSLGAGEVYYGAHADDRAGRAYPDCTVEFFASMSEAVKQGTGGLCVLKAPLLYMNKAEVVKTGLELSAPYKYTWSCYEGGETPCGNCGTCIDRANAFKANGVKDPAL